MNLFSLWESETVYCELVTRPCSQSIQSWTLKGVERSLYNIIGESVYREEHGQSDKWQGVEHYKDKGSSHKDWVHKVNMFCWLHLNSLHVLLYYYGTFISRYIDRGEM